MSLVINRPDTNPDVLRATPSAKTVAPKPQQGGVASSQQQGGVVRAANAQFMASGSVARTRLGLPGSPDIFRPPEEPSRNRSSAATRPANASRPVVTRARWPARYSVTE